MLDRLRSHRMIALLLALLAATVPADAQDPETKNTKLAEPQQPPGYAASATIEVVAGGGTAVEGKPATQCKISQPFGIALDPQDNMFICEESHRLLRVDAKTGILTVVTGTKNSALGDRGPAADARFSAPHNLVADSQGNLFLADSDHNRVRRVDAKAGIVTTFAGTGVKEFSGDGGRAPNASLDGIACLCFNRDFTKLYLGGFSKAIRVVDLKTGTIDTVPGIGGSRAQAMDSKGNLFIPAARGVRMLGADGKVSLLEDAAAKPPLSAVKHLWADGDDNIVIADSGNHLIRKFLVREKKLSTLAGTGVRGSAGVPGIALQAQLAEPHGVVTHPRTGEIYIADSRNHRVLRIKIKQVDTRKDDASPWGIASGAEWSGDFPRFNPLLKQAGVKWLRLFPEWQIIQPKKDQWNWKVADAMVADARANGIHIAGVFCYLAPWASADGGTRKFPIKDIQYWRDYVSGTVERYKDDIKYWEVWNEFNGSFGDSKNKVKDYVELVVTAYDAAKKVDPNVKIGLSVANFDVGFLDAVIKAGAADHFDFICVHPYENLGAAAEGGEVGYLCLAGNLRKMLEANKQRKDIPLWITEIGFQAPIKADARGDAEQADMLARAYLLSIAQGFERVFWFEARGPAYGKGTDHGIIRPDWTPRPAYDALKVMTMVLGQEPRYLGWLDLGKGGYGFLFKGQKGSILAAWSPAGKQYKATFDAEVSITDLTGKHSLLPAGNELVLTQKPVFISALPADLVKQAQGNVGKPYPWGGDYANATVVTCRLGASNTEDGLKQINPKTTVVVNDLTESYRRPDFANPALKNEGRYVYFRVDPQFVPFGTDQLEISIVAKRLAPDKDAGMNLTYESKKGYTGAQGWWAIPKDDKWHEHTWKVSDANFVGQWGWNFRINAIGSPNEFMIKEVRVRRPDNFKK